MGDNINALEDVQYIWGLTSVHWRMLSTIEGVQYSWGITSVHSVQLGDNIRALEDIQYSGEIA